MENQGQLYFGLFLTSETLLTAICLLSGFLALAIIISMMKIYKKCGKPWWYVVLGVISIAIFVFADLFVFKQFGKVAGIVVSSVLSLITLVFLIKIYIYFTRKMGKGLGFIIGMIFLPMIFIPLLSFYDRVEEKKESKEEPIYNPFNQTNIESVMPEAPIAPVMPTIVEINPQIEEKQLNDTVVDDQPIINNEVSNVQVNENVDNVNLSSELNSEVSEETNSISATLEETVIPEVVNNNIVEDIPVVENLESSEMLVPEVKEETNIMEQNIVEPVIQENIIPEVVVNNPTVEDIQNALNINRDENSTIINNIENQKDNLDLIDVQENNQEEIEMPEIAEKVCPACGVSLSSDNKFCTSCGTQI